MTQAQIQEIIAAVDAIVTKAKDELKASNDSDRNALMAYIDTKLATFMTLYDEQGAEIEVNRIDLEVLKTRVSTLEAKPIR